MEKTSKDLLQLEHRDPSSSLESALLVCKRGSSSEQKKPNLDGNPLPTAPLPKSNVLSKVKDFLGVMSEANKSLQMNAKDNPADYDIEVLKDSEIGYIEMDLMLGIADLETPQAVAAAEAAINGREPVIDLPAESSSSDSDDSEEDEDDDGSNIEDEDDKIGSRKLNHQKDDSSGEKSRREHKRPKIVELP